jgi:hypothetical protein
MLASDSDGWTLRRSYIMHLNRAVNTSNSIKLVDGSGKRLALPSALMVVCVILWLMWLHL